MTGYHTNVKNPPFHGPRRNPQGGVATTPPLPVRVLKNTLPVRGLNYAERRQLDNNQSQVSRKAMSQMKRDNFSDIWSESPL